jgi:hypothetical protein
MDGQMDGQTQTDTTKLIVAFHNFVNTPKNEFLGVFFFLRVFSYKNTGLSKVEINLQETGYECAYNIHLSQGRNQ